MESEQAQVQSVYDDVALLQEQVTVLQQQVSILQDKVEPINFVTGQTVETNEKLNGKTVYCKTVDVGMLPNATNKLVCTGLNMSEVDVVKIEGIARNTGGTTILLPNASQSSSYSIGCFVTAGGNIQIGTTIDRSDYAGLVKVYYVNKN